MEQVCKTLGVSQRRACRLLKQPRATPRHRASPPADESRLTSRIIVLACDYGRYGYRRVTALLRREGLKVPKKQHKRGRLWLTDGNCLRMRPEYRNHVWSYDFVADRTKDGRPLKMLTMIDEYTRECLAIPVEHRIRSMDVLEILSEQFLFRGAPDYIRSDNGSEFTADLIRTWLARLDV